MHTQKKGILQSLTNALNYSTSITTIITKTVKFGLGGVICMVRSIKTSIVDNVTDVDIFSIKSPSFLQKGHKVCAELSDNQLRYFTMGEPTLQKCSNTFSSYLYQTGEVLTESRHHFSVILEFSLHLELLHSDTVFVYKDPHGTIETINQHSLEFTSWVENMKCFYPGFEVGRYIYRYYIPMFEDEYIDENTGWSIPY